MHGSAPSLVARQERLDGALRLLVEIMQTPGGLEHGALSGSAVVDALAAAGLVAREGTALTVGPRLQRSIWTRRKLAC